MAFLQSATFVELPERSRIDGHSKIGRLDAEPNKRRPVAQTIEGYGSVFTCVHRGFFETSLTDRLQTA